MPIVFNPDISSAVTAGAKLGESGLPERIATLLDNIQAQKAQTERTALSSGFTPAAEGQGQFKIGQQDWAKEQVDISKPSTVSEAIALERLDIAKQNQATKGIPTDKQLWDDAQSMVASQMAAYKFNPQGATPEEINKSMLAQIQNAYQMLVEQRAKQFGVTPGTIIEEPGDEEDMGDEGDSTQLTVVGQEVEMIDPTGKHWLIDKSEVQEALAQGWRMA